MMEGKLQHSRCSRRRTKIRIVQLVDASWTPGLLFDTTNRSAHSLLKSTFNMQVGCYRGQAISPSTSFDSNRNRCVIFRRFSSELARREVGRVARVIANRSYKMGRAFNPRPKLFSFARNNWQEQ